MITPESLKAMRLSMAVDKIQSDLMKDENVIPVTADLLDACLEIFKKAGFDCCKGKFQCGSLGLFFFFPDRPLEDQVLACERVGFIRDTE